jgi:hypothetical protein
MGQFLLGGLAVAGAATDARKTSGTARHASRTRKHAARAATDARDAALPARTAAWAAILAAGAAIAAGITATATRVLLVDNMRGCSSTGRTTHIGISCRHRHHSYRCSNSPTNYQRFHEIQFF